MKFNSKIATPAQFGDILENVFTGNFPVNFDDHFQFKTFTPAVNIKESDSAYTIEVLAPGIPKDEIKVEVDDRKLIVAYEKSESTETKTDNYIRNEFKTASFKRTFSLNEKVDSAEIAAIYDNGVLVINVPKKEEAVKVKRSIAIK